jgi:predicted extracellular nuclease
MILHVRIFSVPLFLVLLLVDISGQNPQPDKLRIVFYNVENFFDIKDDSLTEDNSFLPGGVMRWNYSRYSKKLNSLYKTIVAAGEWEVPAITAMCEIENRNVLRGLIYGTNLSKYRLGIIHEDSPDTRGIDVCLIYNKDAASVISFRYIVPEMNKDEVFRSRSVLYAKFLISSDTLHLIVNHWPSRRGGELAGEALRERISGLVRELCDSVLNSCNGKIAICGDFNSTPDDPEISSLVQGNGNNPLFNLAADQSSKDSGSYRYRGVWEMIDQFIVSGSLLNSDTGLFTTEKGFSVLSLPFLLEKDPVYPGFSPFSTYRGYRYHGGFSDHLPVMLELMIR